MKMLNSILKTFVWIVFFHISCSLYADERRFVSGEFRSGRWDAPQERLSIETVSAEFFRKYFGSDRESEWRLEKELGDRTHVHRWYRRYFRGGLVVDSLLKLHYHRDGYLESASSNFSRSLELAENWIAGPVGNPDALTSLAKNKFPSFFWGRQFFLNSRPIVWRPDEESRWRWGRMGLFVFGNDIVVERVLFGPNEEVFHYPSKLSLSAKVYRVHPDFADAASVELPSLSADSALSNAYFTIKRQETTGTKVGIDPRTDFFSATGFSTKPDDYASDCTGASTECPNQGADGVNVYYHLTKYREYVNSLLTDLGATNSLGEIGVTINAVLDSDGDGESDTNNAYFYPSSINRASEGSIVFLKPGKLTSTTCGGSTVQFYDLARDAAVIMHEYQHYVTHKLAGLAFADSKKVRPAGLLHEGYSDFLATSYLNASVSGSSTVVLSYGAKECAALQRNIGSLRPFENTTEFKEPHYAGVSWASGLWSLRTALGASKADKLAMKSLLFLPSDPSFTEAVDALESADKAINAGANISKIRSLFYQDLRFFSGDKILFEDPANYKVNLGFSSCLSARGSFSFMSAFASISLFVIWLTSLTVLGKRWRNGR